MNKNNLRVQQTGFFNLKNIEGL